MSGQSTLITNFLGHLIPRKVDPTQDVMPASPSLSGTSVHWHGMQLAGAAWADGVTAVSQRPIPPGGTFRHKFRASPAGTFW